MTQEQKALLTYIHYTLEMNVNDKSKHTNTLSKKLER